MTKKEPLQMTIVYDNNSSSEKLQEDWGFSCFIKGLEKSILFDTGKKGEILLSNMEHLGIHPDAIDLVVLSHEHKDHTGGINALLSKNSKIEVWLPNFFSSNFKNTIKNNGAYVRDVTGFKKICEGAYTTGIIKGWIKEQSLILNTDKGLILVTGCAHPRIVKIIATVKELFKKNIHAALGGFHLAGFNEHEIKEIIERFRDSGVERAGPCHCTGDDARRLFAEEYQDDYMNISVGEEIRIQ